MGAEKPGDKLVGPRSVRGLVWAVLVNSVGMIADGYDLLVVDLLVAILEIINPEEMTAEKKGFMVCMTYAGIVIGMLFFGWVVQHVSHKVGSLITTGIAMLGCLSAACCRHTAAFPITFQLGICRFVLGVGVGGEYPVALVLASGRKTGNCYKDAGFHVTAMQSLVVNSAMFHTGSLCAPSIGRVLLETDLELDAIWRILILIGMIPSASAFVARTWLSENVLDTEDATEPETKGTTDSGGFSSTILGLVQPSPALLGLSISWATQNFVFFGQGSFRSLLDQRMFDPGGASRNQLEHNAIFGLSLTLVCLLAGVALFLYVNHISLYWGMLVANALASVVSCMLAFLEGASAIPNWVLFVFLVLWNLPLSTAGMIVMADAPRHFPSSVLATNLAVICAAAKAGGMLGTAFFPVLMRDFGVVGLMLTCAGTSLLGAVSVTLIPKNPLAKLD